MGRKLRIFFDPVLSPGPVPLLFIAGIVLFALLGNAIYDLVEQWLKTPVNIALFSVVVLALLLVLYNLVRHLFQRRVIVDSSSQPVPALIVLVSEGVLTAIPAYAALRYHYGQDKDGQREEGALRECWLITSPTGTKAYANALALKDAYPSVVTHLVEIDPNDPEDVYHKVEAAFEEAQRKGWSNDQIVADFTGGTKPMTIGMALAGAASEHNLEYMRAREHDESGRAKPEAGSDPVILKLRFVLRQENRG